MAKISASSKSKSVFAERSIWAALQLWIACIAAIIPLSHGTLPFRRPILEEMTVGTREK
jgi:hypothetical protein